MHRLIDPSLFPWILAVVLLLAGTYLHLTRRRALSHVETALLTAIPALALIGFGVTALQSYGWAVFVVLPFLIGFAVVLLYSRNAPERPFRQYLAVGCSALALTGLGLLAFAMEGVICLLMAAPLAFLLTLLGVALGYALLGRFRKGLGSPVALLLLLASAPLLMGAEVATPRQAPLYEVTTSMVIEAPPEVIWKHVVALPDLNGPEEWIFRAGVAYPVRTEIDGSGTGVSRRCILSTGAMPETIEVWDEPRLLRFKILRTPPSMRELSPWGAIHPPHLEGFYVSRRGQFQLVPLAGGRTLVVGTSWYQHRLYPASYWRLWSDWVVHQVHRRVLASVKRLSEAEIRLKRQVAVLDGERAAEPALTGFAL
jgi:hypothetical protein